VQRVPFRKSIGTKILIALIAVSTIAVFLTGLILVIFSGRTLRDNISQRNLQIARRAANEINTYIKTAVAELKTTGEILGAFSDVWLQDLLLESFAYSLDKFGTVALAGPDGSVRASSRLDRSEEVRFSSAVLLSLKESDIYLSEVKISSDNLPYITVALPIGAADRPSGFIKAELNLRDIWNLVDDISFGPGSEAVLTTEEDVLIAHPDKTKVLSRAGDYAFGDSRSCLESRGGVFHHRTPDGRMLLIACSPVETAAWKVIIQQPLRDAYLPGKIIFHRSLILIAVMIVIAVAFSFYLTRHFFAPLNELLEGTLRIGRGDLDHRIAVRSQDEIGRLSRSFNAMVEELQDYHTRLRSLASQLTLTEARERKRIAADLHDRIAQALALTNMKLGALASSMRSTAGRSALDDALALIEQTIQDTRSLMYDLSSPLLYEVGLPAALEQLVETFQAEHGLKIGFRDDGSPKSVTTEVAVLVYQAVRELLMNVVKHADARHVTVTTERQDGRLRVTVHDDGVGFPQEAKAFKVGKSGGFGLFSIRERLGYVGGRMEIQSSPVSGTRIVLTAALGEDPRKGGSQGGPPGQRKDVKQ